MEGGGGFEFFFIRKRYINIDITYIDFTIDFAMKK